MRNKITLVTLTVEQAAHNWCAFTPDDIGVVIATGPTREEAVASFRSALRSHLEAMPQEGLPVPAVTQLEVRELLTA